MSGNTGKPWAIHHGILWIQRFGILCKYLWLNMSENRFGENATRWG